MADFSSGGFLIAALKKPNTKDNNFVGAQTIAQTLYTETAESVAKRELIAEQRRAAGGQVRSEGRPSKKDRRQIHQFRNRNQ